MIKTNSKKHLLDLAGHIFESKVLTATQKKKLGALIKAVQNQRSRAKLEKSLHDLDAFVCDSGSKVYQRLMALLPKIPE